MSENENQQFVIMIRHKYEDFTAYFTLYHRGVEATPIYSTLKIHLHWTVKFLSDILEQQAVALVG